MTKVYFITGANRGIGFNIVKILSQRPSVKIIASTRHIASSNDLLDLKKDNKNIEIVQLDVGNVDSINALAPQLKKVALEGIDVFISNAGISDSYSTVATAPAKSWLDHYKVNALGPVLIYQVVLPYLQQKSTRQIIFISALVGAIQGFFPLSFSAYGQSKAALNYSAKEISFELEKEGFTVIAIHPGMVSSDMGKYAASKFDPKALKTMEHLVITPEQSATQQVAVFDSLTKESNGKFYTYKGEVTSW